MKVLCYDFGGTNIKYGVIENKVILEKGLYPTDASRGHQGLEEDLYNNSKRLLDKYPDIAGVGISSAGSVDYEHGKLLVNPPSKPEFEHWDFAGFFMKNFNLKVVADNDVNTFAACECFMGWGEKYANFIVLTIGTGIGGGLVVNHQIIRGKDWNGGEVGRILFDDHNWEYYAAVSALLRRAKEQGINAKGAKELFEMMDNGNEQVKELIDSWYYAIGKGIANLIYIFNPEAIVIGGGVTARENFFEGINKYVNHYLVEGFKDTADIVCAKYQNDGGILGAYCNYIDRYGDK